MGSEQLYRSLFDGCPDHWEVVPFPDAVDFQEGPGILAKDFHETGVPLIRLSGVQQSIATLDGCNFLDPKKVAKKWDHFRLHRGDLLVSTSATIGLVSEVGDETEGAVAYTGIIRMRPQTPGVFPGFIKYFVQSSAFLRQAEAMAAGSVMRHFGPTHLRQMSFPIPPLSEQRAIAGVLGSLDDKIELNRRQSRTLESLARCLFQSWFVDFDPVHANAAPTPGNPTLPPALAAHFPATFEPSPLGDIPKGWEVRSLDEIADYLNGLALQRYPAKPGEPTLPRLKIAQLRKGDTDGADLSNTDVPDKYVVEDGDVIFSWSGSLLVRLWTGGKAALNQHLFKVTSDEFPRWFYFLWTKHHLDDFQATAASKATTMGHIKRHHLSDAQVVVPPPDVLEAVGDVIAPLHEQIVGNDLQSRRLAALRDALLPKLLDGEILLEGDNETNEGGDS